MSLASLVPKHLFRTSFAASELMFSGAYECVVFTSLKESVLGTRELCGGSVNLEHSLPVYSTSAFVFLGFDLVNPTMKVKSREKENMFYKVVRRTSVS